MNRLQLENQITETYQNTEKLAAPLRELAVMRAMYPASFLPPETGDLFAGRLRVPLVGVSPEPGGLGYYCDANALREMYADETLSREEKQTVQELLSYWKGRTTAEKVRAAYSPAVQEALWSDNWTGEPLPAAPLYRMAGSYLDYEKLFALGIPGLKNLLQEKKANVPIGSEEEILFTAMNGALDLLTDVLKHYEHEVQTLLAATAEESRKEELAAMADTLKLNRLQAPKTLRECIQLMWLYILISGTYNYGRLDDLLGPYLVNDIDSGRISEDEAGKLMDGFWYLMAVRNTIWNGRVILGGRGRKHEREADKSALMMIDATRHVKEGEPQLSLRVYEGMDEALFERALLSIREGRTYPILYNDDINIPSVANAFCLDEKTAEAYVPFGCGEYIIDHRSFGSPNGIINLLKILEITLHGGYDGVSGRKSPLDTGKIEDFDSFEKLYAAFEAQVRYYVKALAAQEKCEYEVTGNTLPMLYLSMLYDDCIGRGKALLSGGIEMLGGTLESYGNVNVGDSLTAIRKLVFEEKKLMLAEIVEAMDHNFEGYPEVWRMLKQAPKFGNDLEDADAMVRRVTELICNAARDEAQNVGLSSYLVVVINNSANTTLGKLTGASADGRLAGDHMANAICPFDGNDKEGLTAMMNSLVQIRPDIHAGTVQNLKFSPELFTRHEGLVDGVLRAYFDQGGTQCMISVVDRGELEDAMVHPEKHANLFVRVGGFSARFVTLEKAVQTEILHRTLY